MTPVDPLSALVDPDPEALSSDGTGSLDTAGGTGSFDVTRTAVTDRTGAEQGYALTLREVTRRKTREQRLEVLNRVLRHNLRNDATRIIGRAELVGDGGAPVDSLDRVG